MAVGAGDRDLAKGEARGLKFLAAISWLSTANVEAIQAQVKSLSDLAALTREELARVVDLPTAIKLYGFLHGQLRQAV
jgi:hypothetical protein